jgi:signal peptidase I
MTVYESKLTKGNFTLKGQWPHIYITSFYRLLPKDVFGGSTVNDPAPRLVRLEFGALRTDTFVPTKAKDGKPRTFFQDRVFVREFFARTGAMPGDIVRFEQVTPYHFKLSLRTAVGKLVTA